MNILILREGDIRRACTMPDAIDAACEALRLYSAGVCDIPLRTTITVPEGPGSSLYMYGYAAPADRHLSRLKPSSRCGRSSGCRS